MGYARVLDDVIVSTMPPPEQLHPDDVTAEGRWWDLRQYADLATWEEEIIGPHGWLPVVTAERPEDTDTTTHDYTLELIDGVPTEVWTPRPWGQAEIDALEASKNTTEMVEESDTSVDKLIAVITALNAITALTNATINANVAPVLKDLARQCKTIARQVNREARLTSGRTEDTDTGPVTDV